MSNRARHERRPRQLKPDVSEAILFPEGLIGCPEWRQFALQPGPPDSPVLRLQCVDDPSVCFVVIDPRHVRPDYDAALPVDQLLPLGLHSPNEGLLFCTVAARGKPPVLTANLLGPLVINPRLKLGRQLVLADSGYSAQFPLGSALDDGQAVREAS